MTTPLRLALFIDGQNAYRRARALFFPNHQSGRDGQFRPMDLGHLIASRGGPSGVPCALSDVRIYSGEPDARRDPRTYTAHRRQAHRWASDGATVITRSLRYPRGWPTVPAQEKGIDVALAVDFVKLVSRVNYICRLASISFAGSPPWPGPVAGQRWSGSWGRQTPG